uniref:Phospholipid scramblase n=1 Tax=Saimiri boliviensis boliviensis TaxID=39432 RepID=A0A2K6SPT4_SAIBB
MRSWNSLFCLNSSRPPRHIACPKHQAGHTGKQAGHMGSQAFNPGRQHGYLVSPAYRAGIPVQNQPGRPARVPWMPAPPPLLNGPPGLEYLSQIDTILINQQIEPVEVLLRFESNNKYEIKNSFGQRIYFAAEDSHFCSRNCCGPSRPFTLRITDNLGQEVITVERPLRCSSCCCPCCLQEIEIQAPPGVPIGYVTQTWYPYLKKFTIQNQKGEDVLKMSGPCIMCSCCGGDVDFEITSLDEQIVVGRISKHWTGILREAFTDADNFGIYFPRNLDVKMKAVLIGACFLIVSLLLLILVTDGFSRSILK